MEIIKRRNRFSLKENYGELLKDKLDYEFVAVFSDDNLRADVLPYTREDIDEKYLDFINDDVLYHFKDIENMNDLEYLISDEVLDNSNHYADFRAVIGIKVINTETGNYEIFPHLDDDDFNNPSNFIELIDEYQRVNNQHDGVLIFNKKPIKSVYILSCKNHDRHNRGGLSYSHYNNHEIYDCIDVYKNCKIDNDTHEIRINEQLYTEHSYIDKFLDDVKDVVSMYPDVEISRFDSEVFDIALEKPTPVKNTSRIIRQMAEVGNPEYTFLDMDYKDSYLKEPSQVLKPVYNEGGKNIPVIIECLSANSESLNEYTIIGHHEDVEAFTKTQAFHDLYNNERYATTRLVKMFNGLVRLHLSDVTTTFSNTLRGSNDVTLENEFLRTLYKDNKENNDVWDLVPQYMDNNKHMVNVKFSFNHGKIVFNNGIVDFENIKDVNMFYTILDVKYDFESSFNGFIENYHNILYRMRDFSNKSTRDKLDNGTFRNLLENI